jgi:hypothetical protein
VAAAERLAVGAGPTPIENGPEKLGKTLRKNTKNGKRK